ncbi:hypothetical protein BJ989_000433 [Nocardioides perillae]|uniref:Uncharacterized protein n=1 Tax=Nocardioides perillae TaxID=1119534 RepID=A0A7Y9RU19_9ACTN|nr:hypothetical protein [Nocardioides perillae]
MVRGRLTTCTDRAGHIAHLGALALPDASTVGRRAVV